MVDEARIGCTSGMLLCLDRIQRLSYILGEIFGVSDRVGAELLDISRDDFRQKRCEVRSMAAQVPKFDCAGPQLDSLGLGDGGNAALPGVVLDLKVEIENRALHGFTPKPQ